MDPLTELQRRGGIARTRVLLEAGVSSHALRSAKAAGDVIVVRRGWVATADADWRALGAVRRGVVISCMSVAELAGLWLPAKALMHVAAPPHGARVTVPAGVVVHWSRPVLPRPPDCIHDHLINALSLIAQCQPLETAMVVWESALNKGLIDRLVLRGLPLPPAARTVLAQARPFADSGLETIIIVRLRWMKLPMLPQAWVLGHRVDLLIGERLIIQIDGATHTGVQRSSDIEHDAQLKLRGYHVLRFSYEQIMEHWEAVQGLIMEAVAQGLHRAS